jgi:predicted deacylase
LRADLSDEKVAQLAQRFGSIAVLNSAGNPGSLRAAAVRAGIPAVTMEAGEPMAMQSKIVTEGTESLMTLISKLGMYGKQPRWRQSLPVYYRSSWVRANLSGILFSHVELGDKVKRGDLLATVTDPITNAQNTIKSPYDGRVIGKALDQVVMPGFATHHIGIQTAEAMLLEEQAPLDDGMEDEDAGDEGIEVGDDDEISETGMASPVPTSSE